jgi:hypothetical protein
MGGNDRKSRERNRMPVLRANAGKGGLSSCEGTGAGKRVASREERCADSARGDARVSQDRLVAVLQESKARMGELGEAARGATAMPALLPAPPTTKRWLPCRDRAVDCGGVASNQERGAHAARRVARIPLEGLVEMLPEQQACVADGRGKSLGTDPPIGMSSMPA